MVGMLPPSIGNPVLFAPLGQKVDVLIFSTSLLWLAILRSHTRFCSRQLYDLGPDDIGSIGFDSAWWVPLPSDWATWSSAHFFIFSNTRYTGSLNTKLTTGVLL